MTHDQGGPLNALDDIGHGEGLAAPGYAKEGLLTVSFGQSSHQLFNCLWLIAGRFELRDDLEGRHMWSNSPFPPSRWIPAAQHRIVEYGKGLSKMGAGI